MLNIGRMGLILIAVLTLVYVCLYFYFREGAKMRLEEDWVQEGRPGDRDAYVDARIGPKADRVKRWLILPVYVLPITVLSVIVYLTN